MQISALPHTDTQTGHFGYTRCDHEHIQRFRFQKSPEVTIRSVRSWHADADARTEAMAVKPRSGAGVLYRMHALWNFMQPGVVGLDESASLRLHLSETKQRKARPEHLGEDC